MLQGATLAAARRAACAAAAAEPTAEGVLEGDVLGGADGGLAWAAGTRGGAVEDHAAKVLPWRFRAGVCNLSHQGRPSLAAASAAARSAAWCTEAAEANLALAGLDDALAGLDDGAEAFRAGERPMGRRR